MKNIRVRVRFWCRYRLFDFGIYEGGKILMVLNPANKYWIRKDAAIRNAKKMAKRIGIKFDPNINIIKQ